MSNSDKWADKARALLIRIADFEGDDYDGPRDWSEEAADLVYETPKIKGLRVGDRAYVSKYLKKNEATATALYDVSAVEPDRIEFVYVEGQPNDSTIGMRPSHSYLEKRLWLDRQKAGLRVEPVRRLIKGLASLPAEGIAA